MREKPEFAPEVQERLDDLNSSWNNLEACTKEKGERLFEANRPAIYEQNIEDIDTWINVQETQIMPEDASENLKGINIWLDRVQVGIFFLCIRVQRLNLNNDLL